MRGIGESADPGDWTLEVLPVSAELNLGHQVLCDTEHGGEFPLEHQPPLRANVGDVVLGETVLPVINALGGAVPAAGNPVGIVVPLRPEFEVRWVAAGWIVALVPYLEAGRYVAVGHTIGDAVGAVIEAAEAVIAVSSSGGPCPRPAFVGAADANEPPEFAELIGVTPMSRHGQYSTMAVQ